MTILVMSTWKLSGDHKSLHYSIRWLLDVSEVVLACAVAFTSGSRGSPSAHLLFLSESCIDRGSCSES